MDEGTFFLGTRISRDAQIPLLRDQIIANAGIVYPGDHIEIVTGKESSMDASATYPRQNHRQTRYHAHLLRLTPCTPEPFEVLMSAHSELGFVDPLFRILDGLSEDIVSLVCQQLTRQRDGDEGEGHGGNNES